MIEGHGDDLYRYGGKVRLNFSTNIVSCTDHTELIRHLSGIMGIIGGYPEPAPYSLERKIAGKIGVAPENVVVTNGATDAMYRIAHIYQGKRSVIPVPAFREYQDACRAYGHDIRFVNGLEKNADADCVWICNPNNPTGEVYDKEELLSWRVPLMILDQAYADYTIDPVVSPDEAVANGNIILLSSLTKRYAVPGLRIGYIVAHKTLAARVRAAGMPWAVNSLAIEAGKYLIDHDRNYIIDAEVLYFEALRVERAFADMGIDCSSTRCNFFLGKLPKGRSFDLKEWLVNRYAILIRDASNFEGLDDRYIRVAVQRREQNDLLINAIREWLTYES